MKFLVLGDVEVRIDGLAAPLDSAMSRGLLAMLLLNANQFVSSERLIEALWERPPASAGSNLRTYATQLRRVFDDAGVGQPLETRRGGGYRVEVNPGEFDHQVLTGLVRVGRAALRAGQAREAAAALSEALELWRGTAGDDLPARSPIAKRMRALNESRLSVIEDLVEARIAVDDVGDLVDELSGHIAANPLRERPYGQLMRVLHRAGEPSAAMALYERLRMLLREELGIEPSRDLQALRAAILTGDEPVAASALTPA